MKIKSCKSGMLWTCVVVLTMCVSMLQAEPECRAAAKDANSKSEVSTMQEKRSLTLNIVHKETGQPLTEVSVSTASSCQKKQVGVAKDGNYSFPLPDKDPDYLGITLRKDGFVPLSLSWRPANAKISIPEHYTVRLEPGTSIGGFIQNQDGKPIANASVFLLDPGGNENEIEKTAIRDYQVKTDANGFWRCDIMPAKLDDVWIRLAHPEYSSDQMYGITPKPTMEKLRDMTGIMVMNKGLAVHGRVLDANDKPIAGASVMQGSDRWGSHYPSTTTDGEGRFIFENAKQGQMILTVQAAGYSPDLKQIQVVKDMPAIEFKLNPANTIKGRVVDTAGKPIAGAFVAADTWRGHRSITWRGKTDSEGRFVWNQAPVDQVLFDMGQKKYMSVRSYGMTPSDTEYVITMHRELNVQGSVTDAETGEPIKQFKVVLGIDWQASSRVSWERRHMKTYQQGKYDVSFSYPYPAHLIRIEAEGYLPEVSRPIKSDEEQVTCDFKLKKGSGPTGTVVTADYKPVSGAEVVICTPSQGAHISNGRNQQKNDSCFVETSFDGTFSFPPQTEPYTLVVIHDSGCAEVSAQMLAESSKIVLQPWGRLKGILKIGTEPGRNETVAVIYQKPYEPNVPDIFYDNRTTTDNDGKFIFERLAPGQAMVYRSIKISDRMTGSSHGVPVEVVSGQTTGVSIGGTGRPVVGKVVAPADCNQPINWSYGDNNITTKMPPMPKPENPEEMSPEEKQNWYKNWQQSEEGKAFQENRRKQSRHYAVKLESDGSFRAVDIPAGSYTLQVQIQEPPVGRSCGFGETVGTLQHDFVIPEMSGGRSDEPLDLGSLELKLLKKLKPGAAAPLFEAKTLDGKTIKLEQLRGKVVLLEFWATWCGPCVQKIPELKDIYNTFGRDERFVMIGLNFDPKIETAQKTVQEKEIQWPNAFLGEMSKSQMVKDYAVEGIPTVVVIDADGKILTHGINLSSLKSTIQNALSKK